MKIILVPSVPSGCLQRISVLLLLALSLHLHSIAATNDSLADLLRKGLYEEEGNRDLPAATQAYLSVITQHDAGRETAGHALFRLGECYRKQGKTNDAISCYQRVLTDFNDVATVSGPAREALGAFPQFTIFHDAQAGGAGNTNLPVAVVKQKELLAQELALVEQLMASRKKMIEVGRAAPDDLIPIQRDVLSLKRQMAVLDATRRVDLLDLSVLPTDAKPATAPSEEETMTVAESDLLKRFKTMVANSPDLLNASFRGPLPEEGNYSSPLVYAVMKGYSTATRYLLENGARIDLPSSRGALYEAANRGHRRIVELLLAKGMDVNAVNNNGETALHTAAANGFVTLVRLLLDRQADWKIVDFRRTDGWDGGSTPIQRAAQQGQRETLQELLNHGADANQLNLLGFTALHAAARGSATSALELLLEKGADPNVVATNPQPSQNYLLSGTPLGIAVRWQSPQNTTTLLKRGARPDLCSPGELSPLLYASWRTHTNFIAILVQNGADIKQTDAEKKTALHWLALDKNEYGGGSPREQVAAMLVALGADPNARDSKGMTPLHYAARKDNPVLVEKLVALGADPKIKDSSGKTALEMVGTDGFEPLGIPLPGRALSDPGSITTRILQGALSGTTNAPAARQNESP